MPGPVAARTLQGKVERRPRGAVASGTLFRSVVMPSVGRRVRGAIGIGLTWALAWFGAGMVLLLIVGVGAADVPFPLFFGLLGFIAGVVFAGILAMGAGPRRLEQLSLARVSGWGWSSPLDPQGFPEHDEPDEDSHCDR